jgi:hypothetical protein
MNFEDFTIEDGILPEGCQIRASQGYLKANIPDHPLADESGWVAVHRVVAFAASQDKNGAKCHWCGFWVPWTCRMFSGQEHVVNVDHLDENPKNNTAANLVTACCWCNSNRGWARQHQGFFEKAISMFGNTFPALRGNLKQYAESLGIDHKQMMQNYLATSCGLTARVIRFCSSSRSVDSVVGFYCQIANCREATARKKLQALVDKKVIVASANDGGCITHLISGIPVSLGDTGKEETA